jgi:membrane fusion protein, multidrug efflux system
MTVKQKVRLAVALLAVGALLLLAYELFFWFTHVYEDNARVQTDITKISAQVDGRIEAIPVREGEAVRKGQLLIVLWHDDIKLNIEALHTNLKLQQAEGARLVAERAAFEAELASKQATQRERIHASELEAGELGDRIKLAEHSVARTKEYFDKKVTPESTLIAEQDKLLMLRGEASLLSGRIAVARKELDQLKATERQLDAMAERIKVAGLEEARIRDDIRKQEVALSYRQILSPIDGVVGHIQRFPGEYLEDGVPILMLHDPKLYWIEAYVDESEIRHVRVGQAVRINLGAYPWTDFYGQVTQIGSITATEMGLADRIADQGRFGGPVERVPVRVSLDDPPPLLTPGMRAEINVRIYEHIKLW